MVIKNEPRKVFWVDIGTYPWFRTEKFGMIQETQPTTVLAMPVYSEQWKMIETQQMSCRRIDVKSIDLYHVWAVDTSASNFFMWTGRQRKLVHLGGSQTDFHLLHFSANGVEYVGEFDFYRATNLVECPPNADIKFVFEVATAFAKRRIENQNGATLIRTEPRELAPVD